VGILDDLAALEQLIEFSYHGYLLEGTDSRGIDVGYLIREDKLQVLDLKQLPAPQGLTSRPPLSIHVRFLDGGQELVLFNNHFLSLSAGEAATEPRRTAQAAWNASLVEAQLESEPGVWVVVLGDLNSFFVDPPIERLRAAGMKHVFDALPASERYTYVFQGVSQTLDHILVSGDMWEELVEVKVLHLNADYPPPMPGDPSPRRESDHDPVVAFFELMP
jgi:predicted extracellular nuclease